MSPSTKYGAIDGKKYGLVEIFSEDSLGKKKFVPVFFVVSC